MEDEINITPEFLFLAACILAGPGPSAYSVSPQALDQAKKIVSILKKQIEPKSSGKWTQEQRRQTAATIWAQMVTMDGRRFSPQEAWDAADSLLGSSAEDQEP